MLNTLQDLPLLRETYQEGREKGVEEGIEKGQRESLVVVYESRLGKMPGPVRDALQKIDDLGLMRSLFPLFLGGSAEDIARKLLSPCRSESGNRQT